MNKKHKQVLGIFFFNFLIICFFLSANVSALTYNLQVKENDQFIWEVKELNQDKFEFTFNAEPNFGIGDQKKIVVREVIEVELNRWTIVVAFWDFGTDWNVDGVIQYLTIGQYPDVYDDYLFIPTPVDDYLKAALESLPSDYYAVSASAIGRQGKSDIGVDYRVEKVFDNVGAIISETWFDEVGSVIVKMERIGFFIPLGNSFIGFMMIGIISLVAILLKKNKIRFD